MPPGPGSEVPEYEPITKEISHQPNWYDIPKDGGGDPDLADY